MKSATHMFHVVILHRMLLKKRQGHVPSPARTSARPMALVVWGAISELPSGDCPLGRDTFTAQESETPL